MGKPRKWKRGRPKSSRAGCLLCKPHKAPQIKDTWEAQTIQERKARIAERQALTEV